ncbi:hypothetical protein D3C86_2102900 [compost metagenome]
MVGSLAVALAGTGTQANAGRREAGGSLHRYINFNIELLIYMGNFYGRNCLANLQILQRPCGRGKVVNAAPGQRGCPGEQHVRV